MLVSQDTGSGYGFAMARQPLICSKQELLVVDDVIDTDGDSGASNRIRSCRGRCVARVGPKVKHVGDVEGWGGGGGGVVVLVLCLLFIVAGCDMHSKKHVKHRNKEEELSSALWPSVRDFVG